MMCLWYMLWLAETDDLLGTGVPLSCQHSNHITVSGAMQWHNDVTSASYRNTHLLARDNAVSGINYHHLYPGGTTYRL